MSNTHAYTLNLSTHWYDSPLAVTDMTEDGSPGPDLCAPVAGGPPGFSLFSLLELYCTVSSSGKQQVCCCQSIFSSRPSLSSRGKRQLYLSPPTPKSNCCVTWLCHGNIGAGVIISRFLDNYIYVHYPVNYTILKLNMSF